MNGWARVAMKLYCLLLHLYPSHFRDEFKEEMRVVFKDVLDNVDIDSRSNTMILFARELRDFPRNLIYQYWLAIRRENDPMATLRESNNIQNEDHQPGTWVAAFLAGFPHLLMGLLIGLSKLSVFDVYESSQIFSMIIGVSLAILVAVMLIFAWSRGWPTWSASWYLYGTWVTIAIIGLTIERLNLDESWRYTNAMFFGWVLLCIFGYFLILSKSKLHGLLSVAFLFPLLGVLFLEFVPNPIEGWLAIGLGLLAAATAAAVIRIGKFRIGLGLVLGLNLIAGLSIAYISEYKMLDLPPLAPAHVPQFDRFLMNLLLYTIFGLGVVAIPFILRGLWKLSKRI